MIGPVNDYRDIYVARCGAEFPSRAEGAAHERTCRECKWDYQLERADIERKELKDDGGTK